MKNESIIKWENRVSNWYNLNHFMKYIQHELIFLKRKQYLCQQVLEVELEKPLVEF